MSKIELWYSNVKPKTKIIGSFIILTAIFTVMVFLLVHGYKSNKDRIRDIQQSRIASCQDTYQAFPKVFQTFLPQGPLTNEQQEQLDAFNKKVEELVKGCENQVNPTKVGGES